MRTSGELATSVCKKLDSSDFVPRSRDSVGSSPLSENRGLTTGSTGRAIMLRIILDGLSAPVNLAVRQLGLIRKRGKQLMLAEQLAVFVFGVAFVITLLALAVLFPEPSDFQYVVFRIVLALAAAGVAAFIPGFIEVKIETWLRAGGAMAVFVVVYFFSPANLVSQLRPTSGPGAHFAIEPITDMISKVAIEKGYNQFHYTQHDKAAIYDFLDGQNNRVGYLVLREEDVASLFGSHGKGLKDKVAQIMFGKWGSDSLDNDWNLIIEKIGSLASSIFNRIFNTDGIGADLDSEKQQIALYPIDRAGKKISSNDLVLSKNDLLSLLKIPPIARGARIANACEKLT